MLCGEVDDAGGGDDAGEVEGNVGDDVEDEGGDGGDGGDVGVVE